MKSISLEDAKKLPITSMYMAIVCFPVSHDNFPDVLQQIPDGTSASESIKRFNNAVDESAESLAVDGKVFGMDQSEYANTLKQILYSAMTISSTTVLAKTDDGWIDVGESGHDIEKGEITCLEPFKDYYNEGEYDFEELNGHAVLCVHSIEPFEKFESKNLSNATKIT